MTLIHCNPLVTKFAVLLADYLDLLEDPASLIHVRQNNFCNARTTVVARPFNGWAKTARTGPALDLIEFPETQR